MSTVTDPPATSAHEHPPHLAHHFDTPTQQFESAALGMWLFLATEILLFAGLFCAYAVYRANHPEIFEYAHVFLDKFWGATNTVILLCSSFTMAAGVWAVQHSRRKTLVAMLALTLLCALGFLGIKYVEYSQKWREGLLWGTHYAPTKEALEHAAHHGAGPATADKHAAHDTDHHAEPAHADPSPDVHAEPASEATAAPSQPSMTTDEPSWVYQPADAGPRGLLAPGAPPRELEEPTEVRNVHTFFGVYFAMTGLHGLHVVAGMIAITWIMVRAAQGRYNADYFTPVPMVGLYWHVVDLVWIYLFPLLYLIH